MTEQLGPVGYGRRMSSSAAIEITVMALFAGVAPTGRLFSWSVRSASSSLVRTSAWSHGRPRTAYDSAVRSGETESGEPSGRNVLGDAVEAADRVSAGPAGGCS